MSYFLVPEEHKHLMSTVKHGGGSVMIVLVLQPQGCVPL